jgi:hypothetical protein
MEILMKASATAFYVFGYSLFLIVSADYEPTFKRLYYAVLIPFIIAFAILVVLQVFDLWL